DRARGNRWTDGCGMRRGSQMTGVAIHVDQPWFHTPGGIGTYIRNLVPAMARRDPALDIRLFHARFDEVGPPEGGGGAFGVEDPRAPTRTLYPRWDPLGRPPLPP